MSHRPMDIDPIDGGPREIIKPSGAGDNDSHVVPMQISEEEEARQAIDMFRGDDMSARVAAASRLEAVASVLGEQRTREELLPFVTDGTDDEDEVLLALATSLGKLVPFVGGGEHAHTILVPLELLLTVEENTVRDAAIASTLIVADALPDSTFKDTYTSMLMRLGQKEWFTARIAAANLIAKAYPRMTSRQQDEHLSLFAELCQDETPMARRVAAQNLGAMVENVVRATGRTSLQPEGVVTKTLVPLFESLSSNEDQPDSVRLQTTENCVVFGRAIEPFAKNLKGHERLLIDRVLPLIVATIDDRSWRVRWTAAAKFADVIFAYSPIPGAMDELIPAYEKLLQDPEAEVRSAATFNLAAVAKGCKAKIPPLGSDGAVGITRGERVSAAERLVKRVTSLTEDDSENVRAALAMVATELAPVLGRDATITHLVPPILLLLRDAASEVRLNLISSLESLNEVIGVDLLSQSLLPAILDLAQDGKWRIRLAIIEQTPLLASQLGKDFFTDKLSAICVNWLGDDIASIRNAATTNIQKLTALFGTEWACDFLLPSIDEIRQNSSYLRRLAAVQACGKMAIEMDPAIAQIEILPIILEMATDTVANIRFTVARSLGEMGPSCEPSVYHQQIHPILNLLQDDPDRDVRFFAEKTALLLKESFAEKL